MYRVLHLGKYFPPHNGGIEQVSSDVVQALIGDKYQNIVLCFSDKRTSYWGRTGNTDIFFAKVIKTINSQPISLSYIFQIFRLYHESDIILLHLPNILTLFVPFLPGRKKIIVYWHSDIVKQRFLKNIFRPAINALLKKATKIIVTSEKYALGSPFLSKNMHKCISVPCAANLSKYGIIVPNNSKKTNFEQIRYLFVGRHIPYKGISLLVDAFNMIEDNKVLHIVGDGVLTKELMAMAKNKNIVFTGELTNEKLLDEYLQADVLVLPSITRNEAFGVVIVEAFAFGLPVICFNIINSGVSWVNQDRETGIVVKNIDAKSLKKAILDIADDETKFEKYKINAIKRYAREFSLPVFQERIRRLVDEQL